MIGHAVHTRRGTEITCTDPFYDAGGSSLGARSVG
jgi:hypothetical protein